jgi:hypothetical protein
MKLVIPNGDTMVNPDYIVAIRAKKITGKKRFFVDTRDGKSHEIEGDPRRFLSSIENATDGKYDQFWAG